ncbi:ABC transporter substrate-binding protein [Vibrio sp. THAF190c]|uniref:ABC transporter substrate-binding protein n=1 Tax=Vibrio sp. THAF190c TaxID=2587865 RepID=UPI001269258D|nr:ABC transporter substrate-binding protein [Vibrio sp. THAF190c]QFT12772.1 putative siderophore-binding lipoprotein YfiY precursor [Vibrio sp. THAF190c]
MNINKSTDKFIKSILFGVLICKSWPALSNPNDDLGQHIKQAEYNHFPRVASVSNFGAELLLALGEKPVALSDFPQGQPEYLDTLDDIPTLGNRSRTSFEALYNAQPDLVIGLSRMLAPYHQRYTEIAPSYGFDLITLEDGYSAVEKASYALGRAEQGKKLNQCFDHFISDLQNQIGNKKLSGLFLTSAGVTPRAYYSHFGAVSLMEELNIKSASGASPYSSKTPFSGQIGLEWLAQLDPDIIFIYETAKPQFTDSKIWHSLKAVKNNRVYKVSMSWREPEGPISRIWVTMDIAHKAYPELFDAPTTERVYEVLNESCS